MWRQEDESVTCIACGETLARDDAREYDKQGDRWERRDKEFEHLCKPCYRELCHQPRDGLEALLVELERSPSKQDFFEQYHEALAGATEQEDSEPGRRR